MAERQIDATRAGQTEAEAQPSKRAVARAPMGVDEALAYADAQEWKAFKSKGDVALIALAAEVWFLRGLITLASDYIPMAEKNALRSPPDGL